MEARRAERPRLVLEEGEWYLPPEEQVVAIIRALDHEVRREILRRLERPMRKYEIARFVHEAFGRKYSRSLIEHHLKLLRRAGLIEYRRAEGGGRLVCRTCDFRLQLRARERPPGELVARLRRAGAP